MKIYTCTIANAVPLEYVSERSSYGLGFGSAFVGFFCELFGMRNGPYSKKMQKAEACAIEALQERAQRIGADGVMDVRCETNRLCVMVYGTAFRFVNR